MTADELLDLLTRCVQDGTITIAEAQAIAAQYDNGVPSITPPVPPDRAFPLLDEETIILAAVVAYAFSRGGLVDHYTARMEAIAPRANTNVASWQTEMSSLIRQHMAAQSMNANRTPSIGTTSPPSPTPTVPPDMLPTLNAEAMRQGAYLARFADTVVVNRLMATPMSDAAIAARSTLYAGAGYAAWFQTNEGQAIAGWVVDYHAVDDTVTCAPCLAAERAGPYLPSQGPMPGDVCDGRGNCRCARIMRYDPETFARLVGTLP